MKRPPLSDVSRYACAILAVALATAGRLALDPVLGDLFPFATLFLAVMIVAAYGGFGPALLATALGGLAAARYLLPPRDRFAVSGFENQAGLALYVGVSLGVAWLGGALRAARRRAERVAAEALAKEARLRVTLASIGDAVIAADRRGRVVLMNPVAEALTGWTQAEAAGRPVAEVFRIVNEETRRPVEDPTTRVLREGVVVGLANHTLLLARDGAERPIDDSAAPIRDEDGAILGAVLVFRDVAERSRHEAEIERLNRAMRERVGELETLLEILPVGVWQGDPACERITGNRAAHAMLRVPEGRNASLSGPEAREGRGPGFHSMVEGRRVAPEDLPMQRAARTGRPVLHFEHDIVFEDGSVSSFLCNAAPVLNGDGRVRGVLGTYTDITGRKRAEREMAGLVQRLNSLVDNTPLAVVEWDTEFRITRWSGQAEKVFGWTAAEVLGKGLDAVPLVHEGDAAMVAEAIDRLQDPASTRVVSRNRNNTESGAVVVCEWYSSVLHDERGRMVAVLSLVLDVTERERAEEALREADRRKNEFIATLAHELRNPLAPIRNAAQLLKVGGAADPEDSAWSRDVIERQVEQMARLLDDLLDVSRITRDKMELRRARVALAKVVENAVETSRPLIDEGGHALTVDLPVEPIYLDADPVRLAQVLANLLNNAAKYTDRGGEIRLAAALEGDEVVVSVKDNGIGIDPEMLPRLFEMFSQATPALERSRGGLGIGLSLVKGLVERHGGTVEVRSGGEVRGSEFVVRLPVAPAPSPVPEPELRGDEVKAEGESVCGEGCRIVVADDNRDAANTLARVLRRMGHEVRAAYDGLEALERAEEFRPEVVLLDIGMPRLDGYAAARRIREQPWGRDVLLVALTGWGQEDDRRRATEAGFDAHLVKPIDPEALERLLRTVAPRAQ